MSKNASGLDYLMDGFKLILMPELRQYVVIPQVISLVLFVGLLLGAAHLFHVVEFWIMSHLTHWLSWLAFLLWITFFMMFVILFSYTFTLVVNLVAAPFNSLLAEKVSLHLTGVIPDQKSFFTALASYPTMFFRQIAIIFYYLPRALLLLLAFFIPLVQILASPFWIGFNAWFMSLQYLDYSAEAQDVSINQLRQLLRQNTWLTLSFGGSVLLFSLIPIINLFVMPAAVAGATKLWVERMN